MVAKTPNHPKALSINQGKNGMAEENINKFSTKRNNWMRDNFICICCILLHLREMNKTKMGHTISISCIIWPTFTHRTSLFIRDKVIKNPLLYSIFIIHLFLPYLSNNSLVVRFNVVITIITINITLEVLRNYTSIISIILFSVKPINCISYLFSVYA